MGLAAFHMLGVLHQNQIFNADLEGSSAGASLSRHHANLPVQGTSAKFDLGLSPGRDGLSAVSSAKP